MHVLVVADSFPPVPSAGDVARALASGWAAGAPHDEVTVRGLSAGGRGVVELLAQALRVPVVADGLLVVDGTAGARTAYIDASLVADGTSYPLGELLLRALETGAGRVIVGLDAGCASGQVPDGGAGLLLALAVGHGSSTARAMVAALERAAGEVGMVSAVVDLLGAPASAWRDVVAAARSRVGAADLVAAVATDIPLLGLHGASAGAAREGRLGDDAAQGLERALGHYAHAACAGVLAGRSLLPLVGDRAASATSSTRSLVGAAGGGAGGGAGFALGLLGGRLLPGAGVVASAVGLSGLVAAADLVVAARGELDGATFESTAVGEAVRAAGTEGIPCLVLAGSSLMSRREYSAHGISALHVLGDGQARPSAPAPGSGPDELLDELRSRAARLARSWSPSRLARSDG